MKRRIASMIAISMVTVMLFGSSVVFADSGYTASTGSVAADIDANAEPVGQDETQGQQTEYYDVIESLPAESTTCTVYATLPSSFTVRIPKTVILTGATNGSGSYTVRVTGDIAGNEVIRVAPAVTEISLEQTGKSPVTAQIEQETTWTCAQLLASTTGYVDKVGTITANGLSSGSWSGTFNFNISISVPTT